MRKTKIVCTVGPASSSAEGLSGLVDAGMDVARLNFSHGTAEEHARVIELVRRACADRGRHVAILQDLSGPKVRTGPLACQTAALKPGASFVLTARDVPGDEAEVSVTYRGLVGDVRAGDTILLSDGAIELAVEAVGETDIRCQVVAGGRLGAHKGINLPARSISAPAVTAKDRADLAFGLAAGVDAVALSFVRSAEDIRRTRVLMEEFGRRVPIVAKVEKHEAVACMDEIVAEADGIMVARGDLGVEIPPERIPGVQKTLIRLANEAGKPAITATQMLKSMVENPRPTRAEVTDVANAILDGTDAVMLSEETAVGCDPAAAVRMMHRIAVEAEKPELRFRAASVSPPPVAEWPEAVAISACRLAEEVRARAIVAFTWSGMTTRWMAKYRPSAPILSLSPNEETCRLTAFLRGAFPIPTPACDTTEELEAGGVRAAVERGYAASGDVLVLVAGMPLRESGTTNTIRVVRVP